MHIHTRKYANCARTFSLMLTCTCSWRSTSQYLKARIHTHAHTCIHMHRLNNFYKLVYIHTYIHACIYAARARQSQDLQARIHTYIYTYTCMHIRSSRLPKPRPTNLVSMRARCALGITRAPPFRYIHISQYTYIHTRDVDWRLQSRSVQSYIHI